MGLFWNKKKIIIDVTFINKADDSIIGKAAMPIENLPDSFELHTCMHIGEDDWSVEQAIPMIKDEFSKSGKLTLILLRVETVPVSDIRYSLPTIAEELPALTQDKPLYNDFSLILHEDDWLQIEVLSIKDIDYINQELAAISMILNEYVGQDFDRFHIRKPLINTHLSLSLDQLLSTLQVVEKGNIKFGGLSGYVADGFAFRTVGFTVYGIANNENVRLLGIMDTDIDQALLDTMKSFDSIIVDWCACKVLTN